MLRRSTVHRVLQRERLSRRPVSASDTKDLDRFEALASNDLWQSDMRTGPWLPDPLRPGKVRRTKLFSFLDDHSRKLLHGRFAFSEGLPELELVFRRCLQKYGKPKRVYYDNGRVYRAGHMRHIVATLGIHAIVFTKAYRPEGHGKIEAFNRLAKAAFVAEVKASSIRTLDELNEAFLAWMDLEYNRRTHGSRVTYAHALRPFTIEDTRNYLRFHLERAEVDPAVLSDDAARKLFQASQGKPRNVNQLALHALIAAAVQGRDTIDGRFMQQQITAHPLYRSGGGADARP